MKYVEDMSDDATPGQGLAGSARIMPRILLTVLVAASLAACGNNKSPEGKRTAPVGLPPAAPGTAAAAPAPQPAGEPAAEATASTISGKVLERIDAPPYSYLRLETTAGEQWAAVNQTDTKAGETVAVSGTPMDGFESKTLKRKFDKIVFGSIVGPSAPAAAAPPSMPPPAAAASGSASDHTKVAARTDVKVPPAEGPGATTIAALYAKKASLANQQVAVRGKVVKVNSGIMGKNWLHIQDGSGSATSGDHDLAVTTSDEVKLDEVVTVRGPVHLDRDFGAGYSYTVILEDAKVQR